MVSVDVSDSKSLPRIDPYSGDHRAQSIGQNDIKLLIFSDLHLEHKPRWSLPDRFPEFDVCIAAGDIDGSPAASIERLASNPGFSGKPIVFVAGNHEFYGNVLEDAIEQGRAAAARTGVHFLSSDSVTIDGAKFIGATLWTDFDLFGRRDLSMESAAAGMNDHKLIKRRAIRAGHPGKFRLAPKETAYHHTHARGFIADELAKPFDGPRIVVTHHAPSARSVPPRLSRHELTPAYASNLEPIFYRYRPNAWVHGHVHQSVDYYVGQTRVLSNPKGYGPSALSPAIENHAFNPYFIAQVSSRADDLTFWT